MAESGVSQLGESTAKQALDLMGIRVTRGKVASDAEEAIGVADEIGYPVVLKVESQDIPHKSEAGGVRVNIEKSNEIAQVFNEICASVREFDSNAKIKGVGVYEMIEDAIELIVGVKRDPVFGPIVLLGSGGIMVEMLKDTVIRVAPVSHSDAVGMIEELKIYPLLKGARGRVKSDLDAVADTKLSNFTLSTELIAELEINPLMLFAEGKGVCAADALISLSAAGDPFNAT